MEAAAEGILAAADERDRAIADLFRFHYADLVRLASLITADHAMAEELTQEAFVRTWRAWNRIRNEDSAPFYLRRTVINLSKSSLRARMRELRRTVVPSRPSQFDDARLDWVRAVQALPKQQRACVALRYFEDLSEEETAHLLGVSIGTVKSQTHKALKKLQEKLGGDMR